MEKQLLIWHDPEKIFSWDLSRWDWCVVVRLRGDISASDIKGVAPIDPGSDDRNNRTRFEVNSEGNEASDGAARPRTVKGRTSARLRGVDDIPHTLRLFHTREDPRSVDIFGPTASGWCLSPLPPSIAPSMQLNLLLTSHIYRASHALPVTCSGRSQQTHRGRRHWLRRW